MKIKKGNDIIAVNNKSAKSKSSSQLYPQNNAYLNF